jgi:hypothetical protein
MSNTDFNKLAKEIHQYNKEAGWWDGDREIETALMLVVTEIAEATEGERKNLMDDHLPNRKMGEVELADALIRMLDIGGKLEIECSSTTDCWVNDGFSIFREHLELCSTVIEFYDSFSERNNRNSLSFLYTQFIAGILTISEQFDYDVMAAMYEKIEYNKTRADHKKENRAKAGGKKV